MTIETLRGRYRLHRFPPRQRAVTGEPLTASISAADYQRQLMDGFQEGLQKGFAQGMTEGQEQGFSEGHQQGFAVADNVIPQHHEPPAIFREFAGRHFRAWNNFSHRRATLSCPESRAGSPAYQRE